MANFFSNLLGGFTGAAQQRDIQRGDAAAQNLLATGYNAAGGALDTAQTQATNYLSPYISSGTRYQQMYDDLMGLNGPEARTTAQSTITSDPLWTGQLAASSQAAQRALNARGLGGSGAAALAGQRVLNEQYQPVLNRYQTGAQTGQQAAMTGAGLAGQFGSERANLEFGYGQQQASRTMNTANAMAGTRNILGQNLMGLASTAIAGFTPGFSGVSAFGNMGNMLFGAGAGANKMAGSYGQPAQPPSGYYTNPLYSTVPYGGM